MGILPVLQLYFPCQIRWGANVVRTLKNRQGIKEMKLCIFLTVPFLYGTLASSSDSLEDIDLNEISEVFQTPQSPLYPTDVITQISHSDFMTLSQGSSDSALDSILDEKHVLFTSKTLNPLKESKFPQFPTDELTQISHSDFLNLSQEASGIPSSLSLHEEHILFTPKVRNPPSPRVIKKTQKRNRSKRISNEKSHSRKSSRKRIRNGESSLQKRLRPKIKSNQYSDFVYSAVDEEKLDLEDEEWKPSTFADSNDGEKKDENDSSSSN
jgi:hypothetical protein